MDVMYCQNFISIPILTLTPHSDADRLMLNRPSAAQDALCVVRLLVESLARRARRRSGLLGGGQRRQEGQNAARATSSVKGVPCQICELF